MPLLVVEGSPLAAESLAQRLRRDAFEVEIADSGHRALRRLERTDIDALLIDLRLPDMDSMTLVGALRERGAAVPVIVLGHSDAVATRVRALDAGADDYLVRPYEYVELVARIRALLRRASGPRWAPLSCGGVVLRDDDLHVTIGDEVIALSPREHALLAFFMRRKGQVVHRSDITLHVCGYTFDPGSNLVNVHVANLRRKLGSAPVRIETVRGMGYRLREAGARDAPAANDEHVPAPTSPTGATTA